MQIKYKNLMEQTLSIRKVSSILSIAVFSLGEWMWSAKLNNHSIGVDDDSGLLYLRKLCLTKGYLLMDSIECSKLLKFCKTYIFTAFVFIADDDTNCSK